MRNNQCHDSSNLLLSFALLMLLEINILDDRKPKKKINN